MGPPPTGGTPAPPRGPGSSSIAREASTSYVAARTAASAASSARCWAFDSASAAWRASVVMRPIFSRFLARSRSSSACWLCTRTCSRRAFACSSSAAAALTRDCASARVLESSSDAAAGANVAMTVWLATTRSPGRSSIRRTRPATGADTTNRSRTRVRPSWSSVSDSGPRVTRAKSTGTGRGRVARNSPAANTRPMAPQKAIRRRVVLVIGWSSSLVPRPGLRYSLVFSTSTRSSRSSRRRTTSADRIVATTMVTADKA